MTRLIARVVIIQISRASRRGGTKMKTGIIITNYRERDLLQRRFAFKDATCDAGGCIVIPRYICGYIIFEG